VGIISNGELVLVGDKDTLMHELGRKQLILDLKHPIVDLPVSLAKYSLEVSGDGNQLTYTYDTHSTRTGITALLQSLNEAGLSMRDLKTRQTSLEEIFVDLVRSQA